MEALRKHQDRIRLIQIQHEETAALVTARQTRITYCPDGQSS